MTGGDCFAVAYGLVTNGEFAEDDTARLCHGTPIGQAGPAEGDRFAHAWVEVTTTVDLPLPDGTTMRRSFTDVVERSNGNDARLPAVLYYRMGEIEEDQVVRYAAHDARIEALRSGHYGPWDDAGWAAK